MSAKDQEAMFGPLQSDIDAISGWLASGGFQVVAVSKSPPAYIDVSGTVEAAEKFFHVSIVSSPDGHNFGNTQDPLIPSRFEGLIMTIFGLSNLAGIGNGTVFNGSGPNFAPADLYASYGISPLLNAGFKGSGDCIGMVELSDFIDAAVGAFRFLVCLSAG